MYRKNKRVPMHTLNTINFLIYFKTFVEQKFKTCLLSEETEKNYVIIIVQVP